MGTFSPLCDMIMEADKSNYTAKRTNKIYKQTPHHTAGVLTAAQIARIFQNPSRNASCNYGIGNDGKIVGIVPEESRAWTSSSPSNDHQAITYEVANDQNGGEWHVSDRAINRLIDLMVDVQKRNPNTTHYVYDGTSKGTITRHDMFANTTCPGPYLASKLAWITEQVNARIASGTEPTPAPAPSPIAGGRHVGDVVTITGIFVSSTSTNRLTPSRTSGTITRIIEGAKNPYLLDNGNLGWTNDGCIVDSSQPAPNPTPSTTGTTYTVKAGDCLSVIGEKFGVNWKDIASLNEIHSPYTIFKGQVLQIPSQYKPTLKSDEEICAEVWAGKWGTGADRIYKLTQAGYNASHIQNLVNQGVGKSGSSSTNSNSSKSALDIAKEIWYNGKYGTGNERKKKVESMGYNYSEVQNYVNQLASGKIK